MAVAQPWVCLDLVLSVEDLEDSSCRRRSLRHLRDDDAQLRQRKEDEDQVQAELLVLAQRQRAVDDLPAGK